MKNILCNFLVRTLQYFQKNLIFLPMKTWKKPLSNVAHNCPQIFFQYCPPAKNQPKSPFLFHNNGSLQDFYTVGPR